MRRTRTKEEEHESAALDLSRTPASLGRLLSSGSKRNRLPAWAPVLHRILFLPILKPASLCPAEPKGRQESSLCTAMPKGTAGSFGRAVCQKERGATRSISERNWPRYGCWGGRRGAPVGSQMAGGVPSGWTSSLQLYQAKARWHWVTLAYFLLSGFFFPCYLYVTIAQRMALWLPLATLSGSSSVERGTCS